jgi:hypothetical protein
MISARRLIGSISTTTRMTGVFPNLRPQRKAFLVREIEFALEHSNADGGLATYFVSIRYGDKLITDGFIPIAAFVDGRRKSTDIVVGIGATTYQSYATWRLPKPIIIFPGSAELSIQGFGDRTIIPNETSGFPTVNNSYVYTCTVSLIGEEIDQKTLPQQMEIPYVAGKQYPVPVNGTGATAVIRQQQESYVTDRTVLRNGTRAPLTVHGIRGLIGLVSATNPFNPFRRYETSFPNVNVNEVGRGGYMVRLYDWKGRAVTRNAVPFSDLFDKTTREWQMRAVIPPGGFFRAYVDADQTVNGAFTVGSYHILSLHGSRVERF